MNIYASEKTLPYVYKLTHKETNQFYIGVRWANKVPSTQDLGTHYFTSSKQIKELGFENFETLIIAEFFDAQEARNFEILLITENWKSTLKLNRSIGGNKFGGVATNETRAKMSKARTGYKMSIESREKLSKAKTGIPSIRTNFSMSDSTKSKLNKAWKGNHHSEDSKLKISKAKCKLWLVTLPSKETILIDDFNTFCKEHNISGRRLRHTLSSKKPGKNGYQLSKV